MFPSLMTINRELYLHLTKVKVIFMLKHWVNYVVLYIYRVSQEECAKLRECVP